MPIKIRTNTAVVEILSDNGNIISILPEEIVAIERCSETNGIRFGLRGGHTQDFNNCDREEYDHYVNAWMEALAYNRGVYFPEDDVGMVSLEPPEL